MALVWLDANLVLFHSGRFTDWGNKHPSRMFKRHPIAIILVAIIFYVLVLYTLDKIFEIRDTRRSPFYKMMLGYAWGCPSVHSTLVDGFP